LAQLFQLSTGIHMLKTDVRFLNFYISETMLNILLKLVHVTLNKQYFTWLNDTCFCWV